VTFAHLLYIPIVLFVGVVVGFVWGRKAALSELLARERLANEREAARAARRRARDEASPSASPPADEPRA
jgi:hypothetical protein